MFELLPLWGKGGKGVLFFLKKIKYLLLKCYHDSEELHTYREGRGI
jgi:hypothetical protein